MNSNKEINEFFWVLNILLRKAGSWLYLVMVLLCMGASTAQAGYIYVEPRMLAWTVLRNGNGTYFDSVQDALNYKIKESQDASIGQRCPTPYTDPGPTPKTANNIGLVFDVDGVRDFWGANYRFSDFGSNGCTYSEPHWDPYLVQLSPTCPKGSQSGYKYIGPGPYDMTVFCSIYYPDAEPCPTCKTPNPVLITRGEKILPEVDYSGPSGLEYTRTFRGRLGTFATSQSVPLFDYSVAGRLTGCWSGMFQRPADSGAPMRSPEPYCFPYKGIQSQEYLLPDSAGHLVRFTGTATAPTSTPDVNDRLMQVTDAQGLSIWMAKRQNNTLEVYDSRGHLSKKVSHDGRSYTSSYTNDLMTSQSDSFGRSLRWEYNEVTKTVARMIDPAGAAYDYEYDGSDLKSVTYPPDPSGLRPIRGYLYEPSKDNYYRQFSALTGMTDELGHRYSTFTYDDRGRVVSTRLHAGGGVDVNQYGLNYTSAYQPAVTDPLGNVRTYNVAPVLNYDVIKSVSQPGGAGSAAATRTATYDSQRNATSRDDFNGKRACYGYDLSRNLETVRVEGLNAGASCAVTAANATLPAGSRKVSTQWHPAWRLEIKVAEPGRITTLVYNGQPDPFNGNAIASCAPASALLPDGTPIAVVCKRVEQATTDANGALGFGAALQAGVASRTVSWTYTQYGQVLSEDGPRTDVNDLTAYAYYSDTTADHMPGDLQSVTDAVGRVTQYSKYNRHGQLIESTDPNGVVTTNTYDLRMRLLSTTVAGQTTSYSYDPVGQLKKVTLPDQSWIGYDYDGAHRQTAVYDHLGNRTEYVLDNAGNRTGENTKDPSGALKRQLARSIDALGRVQQETGRSR